MLLVWGYLAHRVLMPAVGGSYTEGLIGAPRFINPLYSSANDVDQDIVNLVYSGLMKWDPGAGLIPDLAESYTVSDDELVYTFALRTNATWHDGTAVTPRDVIFTFNIIQSTEYASPLASTFKGVSVEQVDDRTVSFVLDEPFAPFLSSLTTGIMPADYWGEIDPATIRLADRNLKPIGSGPYMFEELETDRKGAIQTYTIERYPKYYDEPANISTITFKFYDDVEEALQALDDKHVEGIAFAPKESLDDIDQGEVLTPSLPQITALFFNLDKPVVDNVDMRTALGAAINKDSIIETTLQGQASVIHTPILDSYQTAAEIYNDPTPYSPATAGSMLDDLEWIIPEGAEFRTKGEASLDLVITTVDQPETVSVANEIAEMWKAVGINATVDAVDSSDFRTEVLEDRSYSILLSGILMGSDPDPYPFWHSTQAGHPGRNLSQFESRKADGFIEEARKTSDIEERKAAYESFTEVINEVVPAVFLYQPTYTYISSKKIHGQDIRTIVSPSDRFGQVNMWYIKTKKGFRWNN